VHGLGVNPADGLVYAATHFGLWQLPEEGQAERVGDTGYDFMGFTVVGPDHFRASGHPTMVEDLPPLLGLIESTDGGQSWRSVSLLGEVDFHALRVAHDRVYGWSSSSGEFMVSDDGEEWDRRGTAPIFDFVVDPDDPTGCSPASRSPSMTSASCAATTAVAAGRSSTLLRSHGSPGSPPTGCGAWASTGRCGAAATAGRRGRRPVAGSADVPKRSWTPARRCTSPPAA
jgi:hypothetical protein